MSTKLSIRPWGLIPLAVLAFCAFYYLTKGMTLGIVAVSLSLIVIAALSAFSGQQLESLAIRKDVPLQLTSLLVVIPLTVLLLHWMVYGFFYLSSAREGFTGAAGLGAHAMLRYGLQICLLLASLIAFRRFSKSTLLDRAFAVILLLLTVILAGIELVAVL